MHWDYWTYRAQPAHFVSEIWNHMQVEAEVQKETTSATPIKGQGRR
jgi:hypothetical protein